DAEAELDGAAEEGGDLEEALHVLGAEVLEMAEAIEPGEDGLAAGAGLLAGLAGGHGAHHRALVEIAELDGEAAEGGHLLLEQAHERLDGLGDHGELGLGAELLDPVVGEALDEEGEL